MPITATLSVKRTFMSLPSRDLTVSTAPSTASMAPRMRTVAGACAEAAVANKDAAASDSRERARQQRRNFHDSPLTWCGSARQYPVVAGIFRDDGTVTPSGATFHIRLKQCRRYIGGVRPSRPTLIAVGFERTVRQLLHEGDHLGAGLQVGLVGGHVGHDRRIRRNLDLLLAVLVFDQQRVAVIARHRSRPPSHWSWCCWGADRRAAIPRRCRACSPETHALRPRSACRPVPAPWWRR